MVVNALLGSPAAIAGLKKGDVILSIDGNDARDPKVFSLPKLGASRLIKVWRVTEVLEFKVTTTVPPQSGAAVMLPVQSSLAQIERSVAEPGWKRVWVRGAPPDDTLFTSPLSTGATASLVYLLDPGRDRLLALRAGTGSVVWTFTGSASGGKIFVGATSLMVGSNGDVVIGVDGPLRLLVIDSLGRLKRTVPINIPSGDLDAVCEPAPGEYLVSVIDPLSSAFYHIDGAGRVKRRLKSPFDTGMTKALRGMRKMVVMQAALASSPGGQSCIAAQRVGNTFSVYDGNKFGQLIRYVAPSQGADQAAGTLQATELPVTARAVFADSETFFVVSTIGVGARFNTVDRYDVRTGKYLGSILVPHGVSGMAFVNRSLAIQHGFNGKPVISLYVRQE